MPDLDFISVSLGYTCGIGIYHTSTANTIKELKKLGF